MNEKKLAMGRIKELLPSTTYRIELSDGTDIIGYMAGRMKVNKISLVVGDKVQVELDPYGDSKRPTNRIIRRL